MRLAVKSDKPPMTGAIKFHTKFDLPHENASITDRLNLNGKFDVVRGQFTSADVTGKIKTLSRKGQGKPQDEDAGSSHFRVERKFRAR